MIRGPLVPSNLRGLLLLGAVCARPIPEAGRYVTVLWMLGAWGRRCALLLETADWMESC